VQFRRQKETVDWRYDCIAYISAYPKRCPLTPRWPLDAFFEPRSVAETPGSIGLTLLTNLAAAPFGGTVYPVNPKRIPASAPITAIGWPTQENLCRVDLRMPKTAGATAALLLSAAWIGGRLTIPPQQLSAGHQNTKDSLMQKYIKQTSARPFGRDCGGFGDTVFRPCRQHGQRLAQSSRAGTGYGQEKALRPDIAQTILTCYPVIYPAGSAFVEPAALAHSVQNAGFPRLALSDARTESSLQPSPGRASRSVHEAFYTSP